LDSEIFEKVAPEAKVRIDTCGSPPRSNTWDAAAIAKGVIRHAERQARTASKKLLKGRLRKTIIWRAAEHVLSFLCDVKYLFRLFERTTLKIKSLLSNEFQQSKPGYSVTRHVLLGAHAAKCRTLSLPPKKAMLLIQAEVARFFFHRSRQTYMPSAHTEHRLEHEYIAFTF
jgi:hypothetical protein